MPDLFLFFPSYGFYLNIIYTSKTGGFLFFLMLYFWWHRYTNSFVVWTWHHVSIVLRFLVARESHLSSCFWLWPNILGSGGDLWMVLCHSMSTGSVEGIPKRWWGHSNPALCKGICLTFLQSQVAGPQGLWTQALAPSIMSSHLVKLSLFLFGWYFSVEKEGSH